MKTKRNMEELGYAFDDELFESSSKKTRENSKHYDAMQYDPLWFQNSSSECNGRVKGKLESAGNWHYHTGDYTEALKCYKEAMDLVKTPTRELCESVSRCYAKLKNQSQALQFLDIVAKDAKNIDQKTSFLNLGVFVYSHLAMFYEEISTLKQLCTLHPCEPSLWCTLAECYSRLAQHLCSERSRDLYSVETIDNNCDTISTQTSQHATNERSTKDNHICNNQNKLSGDKENCDTNFRKQLTVNGFKENVTVKKHDRHSYTHCKICSSKISTRNLMKEEAVANGALYSCDECGQEALSCDKLSLANGCKENDWKSENYLYRLLCYQLVCLKRALFLFQVVEGNLRSFAIGRNESHQKKLNEQIADLQLPENIKIQWLEKVETISKCNRESDTERDEKYLLSLLPNAEEKFDEKWFSWMTL